MSNRAVKSPLRHLSMLGAWALAFGCAVGSDAFVMPWKDFLPKAGPLGTVLGLLKPVTTATLGKALSGGL